MNSKSIFINNEWFLEEDAKIGFSDLAIQRGYGIFDFLKVIDNRPIFIDDHLNRFFNSAKEMNLDVTLDRSQLKNVIGQLIQKNNVPTSGIKLLLTGGYSEDGYTIGKSNLIISQYPIKLEEDGELKGLKLITYNHMRQLPHIKTIDYLQAIRLQPYVKENNADDLLYHNNGTITEIPRANFFIVKRNEIITAKHNILLGITRSKILNLKITGYTILEKDFTLDDLANASEAFITSTTKYAYPITSIDGKLIGDGKTGPITKQIRDQLIALSHQVIQ